MQVFSVSPASKSWAIRITVRDDFVPLALSGQGGDQTRQRKFPRLTTLKIMRKNKKVFSPLFYQNV
jgi:hypothetical protein